MLNQNRSSEAQFTIIIARRVWDLKPTEDSRLTRFPSVPIRPLWQPSPVPSRGSGHARVSCVHQRPFSGCDRPGPVQRAPANRVRAGRQQLSADPLGCRRSPGRHSRERALARRPAVASRAEHEPAGCQSPRLESMSVAYQSSLPSLPTPEVLRDQGPGPRRAGPAERGARGKGRSRLPAARPPRQRQEPLPRGSWPRR